MATLKLRGKSSTLFLPNEILLDPIYLHAQHPCLRGITTYLQVTVIISSAIFQREIWKHISNGIGPLHRHAITSTALTSTILALVAVTLTAAIKAANSTVVVLVPVALSCCNFRCQLIEAHQTQRLQFKI